MGSLLPSNEKAPKFAQIYIYDVAKEVSNQMSQFLHPTSTSPLDENIVDNLIQMLASTNFLVSLFVMLHSNFQNLPILAINYNCFVKEMMTPDNIMI